MAVKCTKFQKTTAGGKLGEKALPISKTAFPRIAKIEAAQAILYSNLYATKPKGTRKKKENIMLLSIKRQIPAAIRAGT
jgi:hypothetical protein